MLMPSNKKNLQDKFKQALDRKREATKRLTDATPKKRGCGCGRKK